MNALSPALDPALAGALGRGTSAGVRSGVGADGGLREPTLFTGFGPLDSAEGLVRSIAATDYLGIALSGAGLAIDAYSYAVDPFHALAAWGASWVMEHVEPLRRMLDLIAGDPAAAAASAQAWREIAAQARAQAGALDAVQPPWSGEAADAARARREQQVQALQTRAALADAVALLVGATGAALTVVRDLVRELIAQCVATLLVNVPVWLAAAGVTGGAATPAVVAQVVAVVAQFAKRIGALLRVLLVAMRHITRDAGTIGRLVRELDRTLAVSGAPLASWLPHPTARSVDGGEVRAIYSTTWGDPAVAELRLDAFPRMNEVNPHFDPKNFYWSHNCTECVIAVDRSLDGLPVPAKPADIAHVNGWREYLRQELGTTATWADTNYTDAVKALQAAGPDSRAIVFISRQSGPGHVFNLVNDPRYGVVALDGQVPNQSIGFLEPNPTSVQLLLYRTGGQ